MAIEGTYRIVVVCEHLGRPERGGARVISRLSWADNDPKIVAAMRASDNDSESVDAVLLNDRFDFYQTWTRRSRRPGAPVSLQQDAEIEFHPDEAAVTRAGALAGWRFRCRCGIDRPVRQDRLDRWIRDAIEANPTRHSFTFEISH